MVGWEKWVLGVYGRSLTWFLEHKAVSAVAWIACMVGTVVLFLGVPKGFLPVGDSSVAFGVVIAREGASPDQMKAYHMDRETVIREVMLDKQPTKEFVTTAQIGAIAAFLASDAAAQINGAAIPVDGGWTAG